MKAVHAAGFVALHWIAGCGSSHLSTEPSRSTLMVGHTWVCVGDRSPRCWGRPLGGADRSYAGEVVSK